MEGQNLMKTVFKPTEVMSTYLLAFIVSDFTFIHETVGDVLVSYSSKRFCE